MSRTDLADNNLPESLHDLALLLQYRRSGSEERSRRVREDEELHRKTGRHVPAGLGKRQQRRRERVKATHQVRWQWKNHMPGLSATKRRIVHE